MGLHPLVVHFPIALLTIYGLMELVWSKRLKKEAAWFYVKATFLIIGTIGAYFALLTGGFAADAYTNGTVRALIEVHEGWAGAATNIFLVLSIAYIIHFISKEYSKLFAQTKIEPLWKIILKLKNLVLYTPLKYLIVIAGLVAITVTGALGGAIVYGPTVDGIVSIIYNVLV